MWKDENGKILDILKDFENENSTLDLCNRCIRKNPEPSVEKCPECGKDTFVSTLNGPCMVSRCSNCGFDVIGSSFFPPCMLDNHIYRICVKGAPKSKYVMLAKLFELNVVELKNRFDNHLEISIHMNLMKTESFMKSLDRLEIAYEVNPNPLVKFRDLLCCELR